jgi:chorismate dehydratase
VAIYTRKEPGDIRSIAMDTSSRTSVALATIILRKNFGVTAEAIPMAPDLDTMLAAADAALIIGDMALFLDHERAGAQKIDLGQEWTAATGLPFVYAMWVGWPGAVTPEDADVLQRARDAGVADAAGVAAAYYPGEIIRQTVAERYLRENIRYYLGGEEIEGLRAFYSYAAERNLASYDGRLRTYDAEHSGDR